MFTLLTSGAHVCVQHPRLRYHNLQDYIISFLQSSHNFHYYGNSKLIPHCTKCQEILLFSVSFVFSEVLLPYKVKRLANHHAFRIIRPSPVAGRGKWQPTPAFLPGESQGRRSLVGCHLWGRTESDMTEVTQQQQQQQQQQYLLASRVSAEKSIA